MTPFAELLRRHRVDAGLSQEGLAENSGLSADAIGLLERGARRHPHLYTLQALADGLHLAGPDRDSFLAVGSSRTAIADNLAPATDRFSNHLNPIIGRESEIERASNLLRSGVRLLTLTGPGGVGKTRLALVVADRLASAFQDGAVSVSLAAIRDSALVLPAIGAQVGVPPGRVTDIQDSLVTALAGREMLLVLDNFEQVIEAGPALVTVLAAAPRLRVLVTSRAPLRLRGEQEFAVQPLPIPARIGDLDIAGNPAVRLFTERARAVLPSFTLAPETTAAVSEICRRLDGLPLAIELAAARTKILSPPALLERLTRGTELVSSGPRDAPERQHSLRATLRWSYDLLTSDERRLFPRLAVFSGGWTLDAAEVVCDGAKLDGADMLTLLAALVDQSLVVVRDADAEPRFTMLETVREFALQRLQESGDSTDARDRHADYFVELAERAQPRLEGSEAAEWFGALEQEHDNFRAALAWADKQANSTRGLRLTAALSRFWFIRGHYVEGQRWIERFLDGPSAAGMDRTLRARALEGLASLVYNQGDYGRAADLFGQAAALYSETSDQRGVARSLTGLGGVLRDRGDLVRAISVLDDGVSGWRRVDDQRGLADGLVNLGTAAYMAGDLRRAEQLIRESVTLQRQLNSETGLIFSLRFLGQLLADSAEYAAAAEAVDESLDLSRKIGDRGGTGAATTLLAHLARDGGELQRARALFTEALADSRVKMGIAFSLEGLAGVEAELGRSRHAARLLGAVAALRGAAEPPRSYVTRHRESDRRAIETALGEEVFAAEFGLGRRLPADEILAGALSEN